jgi:DNA helicase HerA-like ATPase
MNDVSVVVPVLGDVRDPDLPDGRPADARRLGKVAAPPNKESTSEFFYFWVERGQLVERTQIVTTSSRLGGRTAERTVEFVGLVEEVYRQSRQRDMGEEVDRFDADSGATPPFASAGFTYAKVTILRTDPVTHAPPTEESTVYLGGPREAEKGYGIDRMKEENKLRLGLLRNGGTEFAGPAVIDLDYLLGENGGHLNVNGIAGLGAKSSFLLHVNYLLLREAERQKRDLGGKSNRLQIVSIIFNVKGNDLFFIDQWGKEWKTKRAEAAGEWKDFLGVDRHAPFTGVKFFAPQLKGQTISESVGRTDNAVQPYSWSLSEIIEQRLFRFLFAEEDVYKANFGGLVGELEDWLTSGPPESPRLRTTDGAPQTFDVLLTWFRDNGAATFPDFVAATRGMLLRRLKYVVQEGDGVLRRTDPTGNPLVLPKAGVPGPIVIDLFGLRLTPSLQRFVVAAVFHQLVVNRSGNTTDGLRYLVTLDELNRFAPKNSSDPVTQQVEQVAAEMRSQGVILLGAQQQASMVSPKVIENAGIRAVGRSGTLELRAEVWKGLGDAARSQAAQIQAEEKLLMQPSFRAPMLAKIPYPPWALKKEDVGPAADDGEAADGAPAVTPKISRREADFA